MSGYTKKIITEGKGNHPQVGQRVEVHCTGYGKNNDLSKPFWSTKDPGQSTFQFEIGLGKVIKAWDQGVLTMKIGERAQITASPEYAYGKGGFPAWGIMPNSTLMFDIELLAAAGAHSVQASHILVKHRESRRLASWKDPHGVEIKSRSREQAGERLKEFLKAINSASDKAAKFAEIAKTESDCGSARSGGDLGVFGKGQMQKPFEDATYGLEVGQISGIVETGSGSHIIMRTK